MQTISLEATTPGGGTAYHPPREFGLTLIKSSPTRVAVSGGACFLPVGTGIDFRLAAIGGTSKTIDAAWEAGSNQGGLAAGEALSPNTRYYVYLIQHSTTLQVDVIIHQGGCPHPAGWSEGQILGQLFTNANSQIDYVVSFGASVGRDKMGTMWGLVDEYGVYLPTQRPSSPQMLTLHPDGRILPLDLPAGEMIATASQAVPADASTVLQLHTVTVSAGQITADVSGNRFTVQTAGLYRLEAKAALTSGTRLDLALARNGNPIAGSTCRTSGLANQTVTAAKLESLQPGDHVQAILCTSANATTQTAAGLGAALSVQMLRPT